MLLTRQLDLERLRAVTPRADTNRGWIT